MGNSIVNSSTKQIVAFSNSVTDALYSGILIEGSFLAKTNWQKRLLTFIAEKNQNVIGLGIVGIDLVKLEWNKTDFIEQKEILRTVVNLSRVKKSYNQFIYQLKEEIANRKLIEIEKLIDELSIDQITEDNFKFYTEPPQTQFKKCDIHKVYMNHLTVERKHQCLICSNENSKNE